MICITYYICCRLWISVSSAKDSSLIKCDKCNNYKVIGTRCKFCGCAATAGVALLCAVVRPQVWLHRYGCFARGTFLRMTA